MKDHDFHLPRASDVDFMTISVHRSADSIKSARCHVTYRGNFSKTAMQKRHCFEANHTGAENYPTVAIKIKDNGTMGRLWVVC